MPFPPRGLRSRAAALALTAALAAPAVSLAQPVNDTCEGTLPVLPFNVAVTGDSFGAFSDADVLGSSCGPFASGGANDVFFTFTPPATGSYSISSCGSSYDTVISIHAGCPDALNVLACNDDGVPSCPEDAHLFNAVINSVELTEGVTYYVRLAAYDEFEPLGPYSIRVGNPLPDATVIPEPQGDLCSDPYAVTAFPFRAFMDTFDYGREPASEAPVGSCNAPGAATLGLRDSIFFRLTPSATGQLEGRLTSTDGALQPLLLVFSGSCTAPTELFCQFDASSAYRFTIPVQAGTAYYVALGDHGTGDGGGLAYLELSLGSACRADFDGQNGVQVADIFAFLRAWFANAPSADFDQQNGIQVADIFAFLRSWFAGCP